LKSDYKSNSANCYIWVWQISEWTANVSQ